LGRRGLPFPDGTHLRLGITLGRTLPAGRVFPRTLPRGRGVLSRGAAREALVSSRWGRFVGSGPRRNARKTLPTGRVCPSSGLRGLVEPFSEPPPPHAGSDKRREAEAAPQKNPLASQARGGEVAITVSKPFLSSRSKRGSPWRGAQELVWTALPGQGLWTTLPTMQGHR